MEVLHSYTKDIEDVICPRVLISQVYHRLVNDDDELTVEGAATLVGTLQSFYKLTSYEQNNIYSFEDYEFYYLPDKTQLYIELINFLLIYKDFNLQNYEQWPQINSQVEEILKEKEAQAAIINEANTIAWRKIARKRKIKKYLKIGVAISCLVGLVVLDLRWIGGEPPGSGNLILYGVPIYLILRWGYKWWKRKR
jgi:hypothetical protein